jgi:hypothetical protein
MEKFIKHSFIPRVMDSKEKGTATLEGYLKASQGHVREDRTAKWSAFIEDHLRGSPNNYLLNRYQLDATLRVMKAMSEGKTPEEARQEAGKGQSANSLTQIALIVSYFHPRGDEYKHYWNRQYLPEEKARTEKGIVNPAVMLVPSMPPGQLERHIKLTLQRLQDLS